MPLSRPSLIHTYKAIVGDLHHGQILLLLGPLHANFLRTAKSHDNLRRVSNTQGELAKGARHALDMMLSQGMVKAEFDCVHLPQQQLSSNARVPRTDEVESHPFCSRGLY